MSIPTHAVTHPAAWQGADMAQRDDWIRSFSDAEISELEAAAVAA